MRAYPEEDSLDREGRFVHDQPPARSLRQRMDALEKANEIRTYRSNLKVQVRQGNVNVLDVLENPPEIIHTMKLFDLLMAVPKFGRVKVNKLMSTCRISPSKNIGGLSDRQRGEVMHLLRRR